nr:hypothetical protein GCM10017606_13970 [Microbacterium terregens]
MDECLCDQGLKLGLAKEITPADRRDADPGRLGGNERGGHRKGRPRIGRREATARQGGSATPCDNKAPASGRRI